jgi:N-acetylneuraminate lyase
MSIDLRNFRLIAAPHTPMYADGSLNLAVVRHQARHLVSIEVRGAFIAGSTDEGQSQTIEERESLVTEQASFSPGRDRIFVTHHRS